MIRKGLFGFEQKIRSLAVVPEGDDFWSSRLTWFTPFSAFAVALLAFLLPAGLEILNGAAAAENQLGAQIGQIFALAALAAVLVGTGLWLISLILGRASARLTATVAGLALVGVWLSLGPAILDGDGFREREDFQLQRPLILITMSLVFFGLAWWSIKRLLVPLRSHGRAGSIFLSIGYFCAAIALFYADAKIFVGGYPQAHSLAAIGCIMAALLGTTEVFVLLEDRIPQRPVPILIAVGLALVLSVGGLTLGRQSEQIHQVRSQLLAADQPLARKALTLFEQLFLDALFPLERPDELDAQALLAQLWPPELEPGRLDQQLGRDRQRFNLVLISADTLRHDAVGWSKAGTGRKNLTPNLDAFAATALTIPAAYSPYPTSSYAYSSAFTGLYPRRSPARARYNPKIAKHSEGALPQLLQEAGYQTLACTAFTAAGIAASGPFGHLRYGFDLVNPRENQEELDAPAITAEALQLIEAREKEKPFLLWLHYMDPHATYKRHSEAEFSFGSSPRDLYDGEVAFMDHHLGAVFERLNRADLQSNTIVVFFSDHGESFNEHDTSYHNSNLHDEQIRIPFVIRIPGIAPAQRDFHLNLVDLAPTLLSLLGHDDDTRRHGRNLSGALLGLPGEPAVDFSYSERFPRDPLPGRKSERALVYRDQKLIRFAGDPSARIFDLAQDPGELRNIFNPRDEAHQLLLGFMTALDRVIDGEAAPDSAQDHRRQLAQAEAAISALVDADFGPDFVILAELARLFFDGELRYRPDVARAFGDERMRAISDLLIKISSNESRPIEQRQAAFKFLTALPRDEVEDFMRQCLKGPREAQLGAAAWFASRGQDDGRAILLSGLEDQPADWGMKIAADLAALGERSAVQFLLPGLERILGDAVAESVRGLNRIGHFECDSLLRSLISADSSGLLSRNALIACMEVLATNRGPDSEFLLARLSCSVFPQVRRGARELLAERSAETRREALIAMAAHEILGDQSLAEKDHKNALRAFREAQAIGRAAAIEDAFLHYKMARTAAESGDLETARRLVAETRKSKTLSSQVKDSLQALTNCLASPESLTQDVTALELQVEFVGPTSTLPLRQSEFFARQVRLTNKSKQPILGGAAPKALRLAWYFRNEQGEFEGFGSETRNATRFLPERGLAPGESIEILTIGRLPGYPGRFDPVLVLCREPWVTIGCLEVLSWPTTVVW